MSSIRTTRGSEHDAEADRRFDETLRHDLSPSVDVTRRIIHNALAAEQNDAAPPGEGLPRADHPRWRRVPQRAWPWLAAAAALAVVVSQLPRETTSETGLDQVLHVTSRLRITNEDGPVVVTTPSGSRLIMLNSNGANR